MQAISFSNVFFDQFIEFQSQPLHSRDLEPDAMCGFGGSHKVKVGDSMQTQKNALQSKFCLCNFNAFALK